MYRATLTLGRPQENLAATWEEALQAMPDWPGFRPERIHGYGLAEELRADIEAEWGGLVSPDA